MINQQHPIRWERRVHPDKIRQLYEDDAKGILDEDLLNEVGFGLFARCESIQMVTERRCLHCKTPANKIEGKPVMLVCPECGWSIEWKTYKRSYKGKRIHGGRAYAFYLTYMEEFQHARNPREKMLAIDRVVHALHESLDQLWTLPASVNLIEGKLEQIKDLLDSLAYGDTVDATEMRERKAQWRIKISEGEAVTDAYYAAKVDSKTENDKEPVSDF